MLLRRSLRNRTFNGMMGCLRKDKRMRDSEAMNLMQCAYCYSTRVTICSAYEARQVAVIQCLDCGKTSEIDTENFNADFNRRAEP